MNETAVDASTIHGTNPQFLIEKITRLKIYSCLYWKEKCFGLTAETILDRAITLKYFGGCYSGTLKPSPFLCLVLKLLQLQPDKEIIIEFIRNDDFKYLRALGAFYLRLVGKAEDVYRYLEPLYNDYRKLAFRGLGSGSTGWQIKYMDEFIDELLTKEQVCDIALPFLQKRSKLEDLGQLGARKSVLDEEIEFMQNQEDDEDEDNDDQNENDVVTFSDNVKGNTIDTNNNDNTTATVGYVVQSSSSSSNLNDKEVTKSSTFDTKEKDNITSESYDKDRLKDNKDSDRYRDRDGGRDRDSRDRRSRDRDDRRRSRSRDRSSKYDHDDRRRGRSRSRSKDRYNRRSRSRSKDRYNRRSRSRSKDRYNKHRDKYDDKDYRRRSRSRERDNRRSDDRDKDRYNKYDKNEKSEKSDKSIAVNFDDDEDEDVEVGQVNETKLKEIEKANKKAAKKFDKIFGKKDTAQSSAKSAEQGKVEEGSVEYWNQIRSSLGIKALRE